MRDKKGPRHSDSSDTTVVIASLLNQVEVIIDLCEKIDGKKDVENQAATGAHETDGAAGLLRLAHSLKRRDLHLQAEAVLYQALSLIGEEQSPRNGLAAVCLHKLARICIAQKKTARAESLLYQAVSLYTRHCPRYSRHAELALHDLFSLYNRSGRTYQAQLALQHAYTLQISRTGFSRKHLLKRLTKLAEISAKNDKPDEAEQFSQTALTTSMELFGNSHSDTLRFRAYHGSLLFKLGKATEALRELHMFVSGAEHAPVRQEALFADVLDLMADIYQARGEHTHALAYYRRSREVRRLQMRGN